MERRDLEITLLATTGLYRRRLRTHRDLRLRKNWCDTCIFLCAQKSFYFLTVDGIGVAVGDIYTNIEVMPESKEGHDPKVYYIITLVLAGISAKVNVTGFSLLIKCRRVKVHHRFSLLSLSLANIIIHALSALESILLFV